MGRLTGKVALITGAGQGCGLGIAQVFATEGASLVITGQRARETQRCASRSSKTRREGCDLCGGHFKRENAQKAVQTAIDTFGRLDILINNAQASNPLAPVENITDDDLKVSFAGYLGTLYHMQAAFPHLKVRGGSIVNFGSKVAIQPMQGHGAYAGAKEAIRGLSRVTAKEWGAYKIRVNVVTPAALTPAAAAYLAARPEEAKIHTGNISLGYLGDPEKDIGGCVLFLASDDSRYVTGQTINLDGGQVMF